MFSIKMSAGHRLRVLGSMLLAVSFVFAFRMSPALAESNRSIKVMTQNMDAGTDLKLVFVSLPDITLGATLTYAELLQNDIPGRAAVLADEIAAKKPDIISLQEVTLWQTGVLGTTATDVLFDQLELLMSALSDRNVSYDVVKSQNLTDITAPLDLRLLGLPFDPQLSAIRFIDRDVVLARSDLKKSEISVSNAQNGLYDATLHLVLPGFDITVLRGWISVDVAIGDQALRFFSTHLESTLPPALDPDQFAVMIQEAQAQELAGIMNEAETPVILAGDFNANPVQNGFENTGTPLILQDAGYTEIWGALHPHQPGFTWPLYLEDPQASNPAGAFERIDLIYQKGMEMQNIERIIRQSSPFASDHAGVVAMLRVER